MADVEMPLTEHLEELRWRIVKALGAILLGFAASYAFSDQLFAWLIQPLTDATQALGTAGGAPRVKVIGTGITEAFFTKLKVALVAGIFLAFPVLLFQAWRFVEPGLHDNEKRSVVPFVAFGTLFFVAGAGFCYLLVLQVGYGFFLEQYASIDIEPAIRISEYLTFTSRMLLAFGLTFEMPVVTFFLARAGLVTHTTLLAAWRYAIIIIFIVAAVLTPGPDIFSQLLLAAPLLLLYALSVLVAYAFHRTGAKISPSE